MSKTFLSDIIASAGGEMKNDQRERLEYIPIVDIDADDRNFYSMDGIGELAGNIELVGLQQPIRVRENAGMLGRYYIVSGHRRRAAIWALYEKNPEKWEKIPCIVERDSVSPAQEKLRLILANANTREMSDSDKSRQTQELFGIFRELKSEGVELPGSLRKYVAEAANISETKAATLKVIREKLNPVLLNRFDSGELSTEVAYIFAKADEKTQAEIAHRLGHVEGLKNFTIANAETLVRGVKSGVADGMVSPAPKKPEERIDFDTLDYIAHIREEDRSLIELLRGNYRSMFSRYGYDGTTRNECIESLKKGWRNSGHYDGEFDITGSPRGVSFKNIKTGKKIDKTYTELWDLLAIACIASSASKDDDDEDEEEPLQPACEWQTGKPAVDGLYIGRFYTDGMGKPMLKPTIWRDGCWNFHNISASIDMECVGWYKIPEV